MATTMIKYQCKTCDGIYYDKCNDGSLYFHACPPIISNNDGVWENPEKRDENVKEKLEGKGRVKLD